MKCWQHGGLFALMVLVRSAMTVTSNFSVFTTSGSMVVGVEH